MRGKSEYPTRHADQHEPEGSDALARAIWFNYLNVGPTVGSWLDVETNGLNPNHVAGLGQAFRFVADDGDIFIQTNVGSGVGHQIHLVHGSDDMLTISEDSVQMQSTNIASEILAGGLFEVVRPTTITHDVSKIFQIDSDTGTSIFRFVDDTGEFVIEAKTPSGTHGTEIFKIDDAGNLTFDGLSVHMFTVGGGINIQAAGILQLTSTDDPVNIDGDLGVNVASADGLIQVNIGAGQSLFVNDSSFNPLLEIRDDGTLHILTGATWIADL